MVYNPMAFATQKQREELAKAQVLTKKIRYSVHTEGNKVEVTLNTEDDQAMQLIPQLQEGIVSSVTQMLYQMFAMEGERV